eukprot:jgi/Picsp_1/3182/NSC_06022-R1_glycoside hydrolase
MLRVLLSIVIAECVLQSGHFAVEALHTVENGTIVDENGHAVHLHGVQWSGFESGNTMTDGLWGGNSIATDFASVVWRLQLLGFNAVRLPFSFKEFSRSPRSFQVANCGPSTPTEMAESITPPGRRNQRQAPEALEHVPLYRNSTCNGYLPNNSTRDRFIWVVNFLAKNGFYVMISDHLKQDRGMAVEDAETWAQEWASLVSDLSLSDPAVHSRLIVDILNEPDAHGMSSWDEVGPKYVRAMDAIDERLAPRGGVLYAVQGTGQKGLYANQGDGFATDRIHELNLSDPSPFFDTVLSKPYRNRVILSPHVYPASVTYHFETSSGEALYDRLTTSFGSKTKDGYCNDGQCHRFGVIIGDFGSKFENEDDIESMRDTALYMNDGRDARDGRHLPITNWFFNGWNANSGVVGGLLDDKWNGIQWRKVEYLRTIGLQPWSSRDSH